MRTKTITAVIFALVLSAHLSFAQVRQLPSPGIAPDNFLYGLDVAIDQISLLLTFDAGEKAKKSLEIARERLAEVKAMAEQNKLQAMQTAQNEHANMLNSAKNSVGTLSRTNSTEELENEIEIEKELEEHEAEIETVSNELKVKIEIKGGITPEQRALVDSILNNLANKTGEVKIEINNKKGETKIKIKTETGKSDDDVDEEEDEIEGKTGLTDIKQARALEAIDDAREEINVVKEKLVKVNVTEANRTAVLELLNQAESHLNNGLAAFNESKFGEAFGQANSAEQLAENAEKILERFEEELEIEVEIEKGRAKVEVEKGRNKWKFFLETTDRETVISEIVSRTGLSREEVNKVIEFEVEEEEAEEELEETEESEEESGKEKKSGKKEKPER